MPYDEPDFSDPQELVGVVLPGTAEAMEAMAYVFAEEFARMGQDGEAILSLFRNPFYSGAHQAYRALGDDVVRVIVDECVGVWGRTAGPIHELPAHDAEWLPWPVVSGPTPMAE